MTIEVFVVKTALMSHTNHVLYNSLISPWKIGVQEYIPPAYAPRLFCWKTYLRNGWFIQPQVSTLNLGASTYSPWGLINNPFDWFRHVVEKQVAFYSLKAYWWVSLTRITPKQWMCLDTPTRGMHICVSLVGYSYCSIDFRNKKKKETHKLHRVLLQQWIEHVTRTHRQSEPLHYRYGTTSSPFGFSIRSDVPLLHCHVQRLVNVVFIPQRPWTPW